MTIALRVVRVWTSGSWRERFHTALSGSSRVSEQTVAKVQAAAAALGYRPNASAGALRSDEAAGALIPDEVLDRFAFAGTPEQVAALTQRVLDAGRTGWTSARRTDLLTRATSSCSGAQCCRGLRLRR